MICLLYVGKKLAHHNSLHGTEALDKSSQDKISTTDSLELKFRAILELKKFD